MVLTQRWDPEVYSKSSTAQQRWAQELLSKVSIRRNERILDIGCGDGKVTAEIALLVPEGSILGIDNSAEMISFAQIKFPPALWPNLAFQYGDASDLQFVDEFDLVLSFACLHWVQDHIPVLEGIKRSLKKGGKALMQFGGKDNAAAIIAVVDEIISEEKWSEYFDGFEFPYGFFGPDEYLTWLDRAGLNAVRVELVQKDMAQTGREGLASWFKATWLPYIEKVPKDLREDFINEVVDRYVLVHPPDDEGFVHVGMVRLEVEAEKNQA
ncbi:Trans-aconitate 2-methyltransferase [uncultured archaeon]|nr:Trans-aconitate 2-methyltransferase [uncultured archaeon]